MNKQQSGFTLVELIITVIIVGIISAIAMPSFVTFLRNTELRSVSESTLQGLQLARAEAVRRNERVRVVLNANSSWTVSTDAGVSIQSKPAREGSPNATLSFEPIAARRVTFNSMGRAVPNLDSSATIATINFAATGGNISRRINVTTGGQIQVCDPTVLTAGDPRKC